MPEQDPVASLEALVRMRERNLITEAEFQTKRHEILSRMGGSGEMPVVAAAASPQPPQVSARSKSKQNPLVGFIVLAVLVWLVWPKGGGGSSSPAGGPGYVPNPGTVATPASNMSRSQANAVGSAQAYLRTAAFSRTGLIDQLKYEGYSAGDATFAVDYLKVDWKEQAWKSAEAYLKTMSFSRSGLIEQLKYEGFSTDEATYGVSRAGL